MHTKEQKELKEIANQMAIAIKIFNENIEKILQQKFQRFLTGIFAL